MDGNRNIVNLIFLSINDIGHRRTIRLIHALLQSQLEFACRNSNSYGWRHPRSSWNNQHPHIDKTHPCGRLYLSELAIQRIPERSTRQHLQSSKSIKKQQKRRNAFHSPNGSRPFPLGCTGIIFLWQHARLANRQNRKIYPNLKLAWVEMIKIEHIRIYKNTVEIWMQILYWLEKRHCQIVVYWDSKSFG